MVIATISVRAAVGHGAEHLLKPRLRHAFGSTGRIWASWTAHAVTSIMIILDFARASRRRQ